MRSVRPRRRSRFDLQRVTIGDYIVLVSALLTFICLFLPWFTTSLTSHSDTWAFAYSEVAAVVVIIFFLVTIFLVFYPALAPDFGLTPLPFATPVVFLTMGGILLLLFTFELGKYGCVQACQGLSRGLGLWIGLIASIAYIVGAIVRWGSRPSRRA
ncbi:MAG TPA: hypothetical protein VKX16_00130 [Chloroflexota bacterium]|nr:hypothetical protein [Chloroflexota bacterium]